MGLTKIKSGSIKRIILRSFAGVVGLALIVGVIFALHLTPGVNAATDPGLDSGNATVDRTSVPGQTILRYQTTGNTTFKAPAGVANVRVLTIGGGGGGGAGELNNSGDGGAGGGAGEYRNETSFTVVPGQALTVTVGDGGTGSTTKQTDGGTTAQNGTNGANSVFGSLTSRGGGAGGGNDQHGVAGGSGGGAGGHCTSGSTNGGVSTAVLPGIGKAGGNSPSGSCSPRGGAGGGGAGAVGTNGSGGGGGTGAIGLQNDITGSNVFYAAGGGGGGGSSSGTGANGGSFIGGKGGNASGGIGVVGTANTGSGGGGGGSSTSSSGGNGGNGGSGVVIVRFATQSIPDVLGMTGVRMWYKADSAGNTNALWKDSSGFGYDMTQGTVAKQPVLTQNTINFNPAYVFNGVDSAFSMPTHGILGNEGMSAFYGATLTQTDSGYRYFEEFGDDTPSIEMNSGKPELYVRGTSPLQLTYPTVEALIPHVYSFISPNANNQSRIVGVDDNEQSQNVTTGTYTTTSGGQSGNTFGSTNGSGGKSWAGPIAEAIYFNRVITPAERLKVISYLSVKYGVTRYQGASGAGYADSAGTTIWPADSTFKNNIAGIGRDDTMTLNQKQSKSSANGDIVTMGHVAIAASNQANANNFGVNRAFLLWGHNGAATNTNTTVTGGYVRMDRIWKAVRTTEMGTVKVRVPKSAVTQGNNGVMYISTSTTFDANSQRITMTDLGTEYEATVPALPAATSYFSFGSQTGSDLEMVSKKAYVPGTNTELTSYVPGQPIDYKIKVKNNGPETAGTITFTDTLPAGVVPTPGGSSGFGWNCTVAGQTVTCTTSSMPSGATEYEITTEATIASNVTGAKQNTASVSTANDPNTANNSKSLSLSAAPKADLGIVKRHVGTPTAGGQFHYEFDVKNNGPSDVASFTITDTLPAKTTFDHATGISCIGTTSLTCTYSSALANNGTATFQIYVNVAGDYSPGGDGPLTNTGTVAVPAGTTDPNSNNNTSAPDQTGVIVETDLNITKVVNGGDPNAHFVAGQNGTYKITVGSQGASNSPSGTITVTDTLDGDYSFVSATGTNWVCDPGDGSTVTCTYDAVLTAGGSTSDIILVVGVDSIVKGTVPNTAEVSSTTPDPNLSDNISTHNTIVDSDVDLALTKGHVGSTFVAGQTEQYTFSVTNAGPSADSPSYTITDTLPTGVTFVSTEPGSATNCTGASGNTVVNCTGGGIGASDPAQMTTINVLVGGSVTGTIDNSATVTAAPSTIDTNLANNTGNDNNLLIEPNADLSITKSPSTDMTAGSPATYTVQVNNAGPSNVSGFTVTDTLDPNLTYISSNPNICSVTGASPQGGQILTCTDTTGITDGNNTSFDITVAVESTVTSGTTINNSVSVEPPNGVNDPTPGNNSNSVNRNVVASADLEITKSHIGNFTAGADNNAYTIVVTNNGPSDASTFTVTDVLPTGLTFVSGASTAGVNASCTNAGQTVTCTGGPSIGAGESSTITLTVAAAADLAGNTTLDNIASVSSATSDPDTANNTTLADTVTIDSKADLEISKSNATDFTAGNDEDYTIGVVNHGPSDASGFTVTDTLPAGLTFVPAGSDPGCSANLQVVTCTGAALASGANTSFTIRVHTDSGLTAGTVVNNTADIATVAPTADPDTGNNSATDPTTIVNITDLSIQKGHTGTFVAGQTGQYTFVVTNSGPSDTPTGDVEISDTLPEGMTYASYTGTDWDCGGSLGRDVVCDYTPALPAASPNNVTPTLTVTVNIAADKQGEVTNTGTVISTLDDSNPPNDSDSDTTTIGVEADLTATKQAQGVLTAGEPVTYRFEVTNDGGPSQANGVTITDDLQGHFTYQSFNSVSGGTWDCSELSGTVTCDLSTPLTVGNTAIVDITLNVAQDAPNPVDNTASVAFSGTDPSPANPSDSEPVSYEADLEVKLSHESETYHSGDVVTFTYIVINHGPSAAKDVVLTDTLPDGLTFESIVAATPSDDRSLLATVADTLLMSTTASAAPNTPFNCSVNGQNITCNTSTLLVGTYTITMKAKIAANFTGNLTSTLQISSSTPDPNSANNISYDTILNILAANGLVGTGQNIIGWLWLAGVILSGSFVFYKWRRLAGVKSS